MLLKSFTYHRPKSIKEAEKLMSSKPKILAGGTFLLPHYKRNNISAGELIGLKSIPGLNIIRIERNKLVIGAMATLDDISRNKGVREKLPIVFESIVKIATPQIRNMATIGGNICSRLPWADLGYILLALDAELHFTANAISMADYFSKKAAPKSLLKEITIPLEKIKKYSFYRLPLTNESDIPLCAVCIIKQEKETVVAANLGNNFPHKFKSGLDAQAFSEELDTIQKDEYRKEMLKVCFKRALEKL